MVFGFIRMLDKILCEEECVIDSVNKDDIKILFLCEKLTDFIWYLAKNDIILKNFSKDKIRFGQHFKYQIKQDENGIKYQYFEPIEIKTSKELKDEINGLLIIEANMKHLAQIQFEFLKQSAIKQNWLLNLGLRGLDKLLKYPKKITNKPSIFTRTTYRIPTRSELFEINSAHLSANEILEGLKYTIIGRGILGQKQKDMIIESISMLCTIFPFNREYQTALKNAKEIRVSH